MRSSIYRSDGHDVRHNSTEIIFSLCGHGSSGIYYRHQRTSRFRLPSFNPSNATDELLHHCLVEYPHGVTRTLEAKNAVWGGLMTAGAQARFVIGTIISGRCRDIAEHRTVGFPVFARGRSTLGQAPFTRPSAVNVPITISPQPGPGEDFPVVTVHPGDWMIGDQDGVVCFPREFEEQVLILATRRREVDSRCLKDIKAGSGVQASFNKHRGK